jgi:surfeit locus 1 family protein
VFTPARLADGKIVMVNRGFVPERRQDAKTHPRGQITGPIDIVGSMRWPEARHWFTPDDEPPRTCGSPQTRRRSPPPRGSAP